MLCRRALCRRCVVVGREREGRRETHRRVDVAIVFALRASTSREQRSARRAAVRKTLKKEMPRVVLASGLLIFFRPLQLIGSANVSQIQATYRKHLSPFSLSRTKESKKKIKRASICLGRVRKRARFFSALSSFSVQPTLNHNRDTRDRSQLFVVAEPSSSSSQEQRARRGALRKCRRPRSR